MGLLRVSVGFMVLSAVAIWFMIGREPQNHYETLGVARNADARTIKKAFRQMSLKYHPDKNIGTDTTTKFVKISEAHEVLNNQEKRQQYDTDLARQEALKKMQKEMHQPAQSSHQLSLSINFTSAWHYIRHNLP